jgi:hypothetical protein
MIVVSDCLISVGNRKSELGEFMAEELLARNEEQGHLLLSCNLIFLATGGIVSGLLSNT